MNFKKYSTIVITVTIASFINLNANNKRPLNLPSIRELGLPIPKRQQPQSVFAINSAIFNLRLPAINQESNRSDISAKRLRRVISRHATNYVQLPNRVLPINPPSPAITYAPRRGEMAKFVEYGKEIKPGLYFCTICGVERSGTTILDHIKDLHFTAYWQCSCGLRVTGLVNKQHHQKETRRNRKQHLLTRYITE